VSVIHLGYEGGKRLRKSIYGETRKEVQDKLTIALRSRQLGIPIGSERLTVADWLTQWLKQQEPPATQPKTYAGYEYHVRIHLIPSLGKKPLLKLLPQDVREFMRAAAEKGLAPKSIRHFRATLRAALNVAVQDGLIARNAAALAKPPRLEKRLLQVFNLEQARLFLDVVKGNRLEAIFTVALLIALREGEILGLRWRDVDLESGRLQVCYALQRVKRPRAKKGRLELIAPKTDKSRQRIILLPQVSLSALKNHYARQQREKQIAGKRWVDTGMVFTTSIGTMLDQRNMLRAFYAIMNTPDPNDHEPDPKKKRKLLPWLRFHDLRHSAATLLLAQGVHPRAIMELLGHSSISLTMDTYGHVLEEMKYETVRKTDAIFTPAAVKLAVKPPVESIN
jgi:integrase